MSDAEEILRDVEKYLRNHNTGIGFSLRESGLLRLLEAGQDFRDALVTLRGHNELTIAWDAALEQIKEKCKSDSR